MDEPLLRAVVDVALQATPGLVGGGDDPGPGGGELRLVLGVGDRSGGELSELHEALLGAGGQRWPGGARRERAPHAAFDHDGDGDAGSDGELPRESASWVPWKLSTRTARAVRSTSPVAVPLPDGMRSPSGAGLLHAATATATSPGS